MNNCVAAHGSFQKLVHDFFFFCIAFTPVSLNFFNRVASLKQKKQRFPVNDFNRLRGTPFRFLFCIQDYLKAWLAYFATFSQECSILGMPLRFSQIAFRPIVTLYQFSLGQHYRYGSSLLSTLQSARWSGIVLCVWCISTSDSDILDFSWS